MKRNQAQPEIGRMSGFFIFLFFLLMGFVCLWGGYDGLTNLYSNQNVVRYHRFTFILLIISPISFLCSVGGIYIALTGKQAPPHIQSLIGAIIIILFALVIIALPISNIYLTYSLENRGYIQCPRSAGQTALDGGRTWALSDELCLKK